LQVAGLPWPDARRRTLQEMGVETLSDCVRLPRDGLARRLGTRLLEELDQAYGRRPEALDWHRPEQHFHDRLELEQESADTRQLGAVLDILVDRLATQMLSRQRSVRRVWLHCEHQQRPDTRIRIGLLRATAEPARLRELGRVQLAATKLPAPVTALSLQAALDAALVPLSADLLESGEPTAEDALAFIERLRARLGEESVHGLQTRAEHRPEHAWQAVREPGAAPGSSRGPVVPAGQRPLWMLPVPASLREARGQPVFQGALQISRGPERIETGWWDGGDIRRDYYIAQNDHGMQLWIYRDLREARWYLHGLFG
jgi:protein ImuB